MRIPALFSQFVQKWGGSDFLVINLKKWPVEDGASILI
jgi:hypothetical protein